MRAMIFAAGLGTRLRPITDSRPKALVEVGGRTLLQLALSRLSALGFQHFVVNVHHFAQMIIDYLAQNNNFGLDISISDERCNLLDTGGGIRRAAPLFQGGEPFLVHNVDILSDADILGFYASHVSFGADVSLLVSSRQTQRYLLCNNDMRLVGWTNIATGQVRSPFPGIVPNQLQQLAFSGIHVVSPDALGAMANYPDKFPIMDFYLNEADKLLIRLHSASPLNLLDVGKLGSLSLAEEFLKAHTMLFPQL